MKKQIHSNSDDDNDDEDNSNINDTNDRTQNSNDLNQNIHHDEPSLSHANVEDKIANVLGAIPQIDERESSLRLSVDDFHLFDSSHVARGYATILVRFYYYRHYCCYFYIFIRNILCFF